MAARVREIMYLLSIGNESLYATTCLEIILVCFLFICFILYLFISRLLFCVRCNIFPHPKITHNHSILYDFDSDLLKRMIESCDLYVYHYNCV